MGKKLFMLSLAALGVALGISGSLRNANYQAEIRDARLIVQLKGQTNQKEVINEIRTTITPDFSVVESFKVATNGFVINVNSSHIDQIKNLTNVVRVNEDEIHCVQYNDGAVPDDRLTIKKAVDPSYTESDNASAITMNKPDDTNEGAGTVVAILDTGALLTHDTFGVLSDGVTVKLTEQGIQDKISAAPSFHGKNRDGQKTYHTNKVPFAYDYGGVVHSRDAEVGEERFDVFSEASDHGTHCASLAAGNDTINDYYGIAKNAQVVVMKVFTDYIPTPAEISQGAVPSTGAYDTSIIKALEDAAVLGVDIVNMSLGNDLTDFGNEDSIVNNLIKKLQKEGMFINIAAGNAGKGTFAHSGPCANWTPDQIETGILGHYAAIEESMTVGAAVADFAFYEKALIVNGNTVDYRDQITDHSAGGEDVKYDPNRPFTDITQGGTKTEFGWVKIPGWGEEKDYDGLDVNGKIAVIDRGETTFLQKINEAVAHHAIAVIVINNDPAETDFTFYMDLSGITPDVPVVTVLYRDRVNFLEPSSGTLKVLTNVFANCPNARNSCEFTSDGPAYDYNLKPDISAPGENIKGAVYTNSDGTIAYTDETRTEVQHDLYNYYSGTSMATPNYVGSVALALGEHLNDEDYRKSLNARLMSTATPMVENNGAVNKELRSPRIQGSGMVNLESAINSKVYLEGLKYGTEEGTNKAKICLYNTDEISQGIVDLKFKVHNELTSAASFTATTYIYRPDLVELNPENYPDYEGVKLQSINNHLITKLTESVTVNPGNQIVHLNPYTISGSEKDTIDEYFVNGCPIEGFVILEPNDVENYQLSIPFLGFYGDLDTSSPVEPFDFEKDPNVTYPSRLVNDFTKDVLGKSFANMSSMMAVGYIKNLEEFSIESALLNDTNFYRMAGFSPIGTDPATGLVDPDNLYLGNNGKTNCLLVQQFVLRDVLTNTITLTHEDTGDVVLIDHMFDSLMGDEDNWALYKSHINIEYCASGIVAHRAYSIIPMFDHDTGELYPDGTYTMKFEYTLAGGATYTQSYTLHLDSEGPEFKSIKQVEKNDNLYYRVRFDEEKLSYLSVNGSVVDFAEDSEGYFVDLKCSDYTTGKLVISAYDFAQGEGKMYIDLTNSDFLTFENEKVAPNYEITYTKTQYLTSSFEFKYEIKQKKKTVTFDHVVISLKIDDAWSISNLLVFDVFADGTTEELGYMIEDGFIKFVSYSDAGKFRLMMGQDVPSSSTSSVPTTSSSSSSTSSTTEPGPTPSTSGLPGWAIGVIIAGSALVVIGGTLGITLIIKKKKAK